MGLTALMTAVVVLLIFSAALLYWFGNVFKHRLIVTVSVLISWYFSIMIVVILPTDVSSTIYRQCLHDNALQSAGVVVTPAPRLLDIGNASISSNATTDLAAAGNATGSSPPVFVSLLDSTNATTNSTVSPPASASVPVPACLEPWSFVPDPVLQNLWRVLYWTSQVLTWLIFPLMQSFSKAGDFTFGRKMRSALTDNAIYYASYLFLAGSFLIYLACLGTPLDWPKLKAIAATASNTWGLTLLILLLGYGLVEVPRTLWLRSHRGYILDHSYFQASKLAVEKMEAEEELEDLVRILKILSSQVSGDHPLRDRLVTIRAKLPESYDSVFSSSSAPARISPSSGYDQLSEESLVRLHKQLIKALQAYNRTQIQWRVLVDYIHFEEDVEKNEASLERFFKRSMSPSPPSTSCRRVLVTPVVEWYWHCLVKRPLLKVLAVVCAVWTAVVIWSEVTFFAEDPTLSLFAIFLDLARRDHDYFSVEVVSFCTIVYLCICTYFTIFKIRILNFYYLAPHHGTDEYSLLFSGLLLCRLTSPLCLNFLSLVHLDSHITKSDNTLETSYTHIMGHMDVISFISDYFNIYFPIGVVLLCAATWLSLGSRILSLFGFQQFMMEAEVTSDLVQEGRELVRREKRKRRPLDSSSAAPGAEGGMRARTRTNAASAGRSQTSSSSSPFGRLERQGSSSRLHLIPYSDTVESYTSFGDPHGTSSGTGTVTGASAAASARNDASLRRNIFDDV